MGEGLLLIYKTKVNKEYKTAFFSTFIIVLLIHIYKMVNTLPNHDSLFNYYSDQNVLGSGRWALSLACGISSYWDLPWINGLFSCIFLALTVVVIVALLEIKNPVLIGLTGALLASSIATTETFFFMFTADGYMLAMLLSALAVLCSRIGETRKNRWLLSGACICITCGIYQSYVSFALLLTLCCMMDRLLQGKHSTKEYLGWIWRQIVLYIVSLAIYFIIWKLCLRITGAAVNDYQGISEVGTVSAGMLVRGLIKSVHDVMLFYLQWNVFEHGFTLYSILNILFLLIMAAGLVLGCVKSGIWGRRGELLLLLLCLFAIIPFTCVWNFISSSISYHGLMFQSMTLLPVLTAVVYERWSKPMTKNAVGMFLGLIVLNNTLMANISYYYMNRCYERTYAEGLEMMMEIHDLQDEYEIKNIAVIGNRLEDVQWSFIDTATGENAPVSNIHILSSMLETSLLTDSDHTIPFLKETFGIEWKAVDAERRKEMAESEKVNDMGCWPAKGAIRVVDETLVIKFSEE